MSQPASPVREYPVLVVDDEQSVVNALRRELNTPPFGRHRYAVEGFSDPVAALERARSKEFAVVITDFRMPVMDGLQFLKALHGIQPDCERIVLSGQTDLDSLIEMINRTHIYRFIPKPWSSYFLKSSLAQAVEFHDVQVQHRRMAALLRDKGIELPTGAVNQVDQILVVDHDLSVARAVAADLTRRSKLDAVFSAQRNDAQGERIPELDTSRISVQVSDSPLHALKLADETQFSLVIADYQMPGMGGDKFLEAFADKQPDCARIMLSGVAELDSIVFALDMAHIHSFIARPWVDYELRTAVAQALSQRRLNLENGVLARMCRARHLDAGDA